MICESRGPRWKLVLRRLLRAAGAAVALLTLPSVASAIEVLDGLIEAHGATEIQVRALDSEFSEELDLAQWYNVFSLEVDLNFAPDGFGPVDLLSGFVKVEVRYDCVYTRGCGTLRSADTYGNRAKRLPERLRDATDPDFSGVIPPLLAADLASQPQLRNKNGKASLGGGRPLHPEPTPSRFEPYRDADGNIIDDSGYPGADTLFRSEGADSVPNSGDEPARYTFAPIADFRFAFKDIRANAAGGTYPMAPWLPKNRFTANGMLIDRANPFRGRFAPTTPTGLGIERFHIDDQRRAVSGSDTATRFDLLHPELEALLANGGLSGSLLPVSEYFVSRANQSPGLTPNLNFPLEVLHLFGGDWNPTLPCRRPTDDPQGDGYAQRLGGGVGDYGPNNGQDVGLTNKGSGACIPDGAPDPREAGLPVNTPLVYPGIGTNRRITGGAGENPLRPAPDLSNLGTLDAATGQLIDNSDLMRAQGLYYPSAGLRRELAQGQLNDLDFNFTQTERALNRGQAQQEYKELKEAYLEAEFLDSRLWVRLGLQNIVWGKTELFRTTDQFNPVDLALASLPTLEEQRIALWSGRFVYSLYDVWKFNDVRAEFAFNWDRFQPNDLGACGEPFTPDIVCNITFGTLAHSLFGVGIAGVDRPENPWDDLEQGVEYGARIEWRWDRFSFALSDFYGYEDTPYPDMIFFYERNVDPGSGRPRIAASREDCLNQAAILDPTNPGSNTLAGIGTNPDCLKAGGSGAPQNALEFHHANQQYFAVLCSATTSIAASLDPGACAFNIFASRELIAQLNLPPFVELISAWFAGDPSQQVGSAMTSVQTAQFVKGDPDPTIVDGRGSFSGVPTRALNRDDGLRWGRGAPPQEVLDLRSRGEGDGNPNFTYAAYRDAESNREGTQPVLSLDSTLTAQQRALFGCGPYFGTRCDSSVPTDDGVFPATGGVDFLNSEASAVTQSWPGFEGTHTLGLNGYTGGLWTTTDPKLTQPGTASYDGGPVGTRWVGAKTLVLPGSRGIARPDELRELGQAPNPFELVDHGVAAPGNEVIVTFQDGYDPRVDGCIFAPYLRVTSRGAVETFEMRGKYANGASVDLEHCRPARLPNGQERSRTESRVGDQLNFEADRTIGAGIDYDNDGVADPDDLGSMTEFHPLAGCWSDPTKLAVVEGSVVYRGNDGLPCPAVRSIGLDPNGADAISNFRIQVDHDEDPNTPLVAVFVDLDRNGIEDQTIDKRDFQNEFFNGLLPDGQRDPNSRTATVFQSEAAAVSWNILMLLVASSCNQDLDDRDQDLDCFDYRVVDGVDRAYLSTRCSFAAPQLCRNTKGFLALAGTTSRRVEAAGNGRFGRRTFAWHGGQEAVLRYERRNVLGFSSDFAEDLTKTNWGMEFTWMGKSPYADAAAFDGITHQDTLNLTVSVDRPTFINFLNANRTFFFNTQWFFQYQTQHRESFNANGPWNVLFTTAIQTGYYQDRLQPELITVYDFNSRSGAILPSIGYRFTDAFSVRWGFLIFFGRTELEELGVNPISPPVNRADPHAYQVPVENALSLVRDRDEVFMKLRYTF